MLKWSAIGTLGTALATIDEVGWVEGTLRPIEMIKKGQKNGRHKRHRRDHRGRLRESR